MGCVIHKLFVFKVGRVDTIMPKSAFVDLAVGYIKLFFYDFPDR